LRNKKPLTAALTGVPKDGHQPLVFGELISLNILLDIILADLFLSTHPPHPQLMSTQNRY